MKLKPVPLFRDHRLFILLVVAYIIIGMLRLNDLSLYTDSTRYIIWGTSFAQGSGFVDDTQPEPERYVVNAPFFSVLLSPVLLVFPHSLVAGKIWTLLLGALFLLAFYALLMRCFGKTVALLGIVPLVFNPLLLLMSTEVLSETSFLGALTLCFLLLERLETSDTAWSRDLMVLLVITSLLVLLREVAVAFVGAVVLYFLVRKQYRRAILVALLAVVCAGAWMYRNLVLVGAPIASQATNVNFVFEHFLTPPQASLVQEFGLRLTTNLSGYAIHLAGLILYPLPDMLIVEPTGMFLAYYKAMNVIKYVIPIIFLPLLFIGIWRDMKDRKTGFARFAFVAAYLLVILFYPVHDVRFLLPLLPIQIFYVLTSLRWMQIRWLADNGRAVRAGTAFLIAAVVLPNLLCLIEIERTNIRYTSNSLAFYDHLQQARLGKNMFTKPWKILGDTIRMRTPEESTIAGSLKEACIFIGDRKLLELNNAVPVTTFELYLRTYAADFIIATSSWDNVLSYEFQMGESKRFWFEPVSAVAGMRLFRVRSTQLTPREEWLYTKRMEIDTASANGLLRLGRRELLRGRHDAAIALLQKAQTMAPAQVLIPYQLLAAYAMSGKLEEASRQLQVLYGYAQSTTYLPVASKLLDVAYSQQQAASSDNAVERSTMMVNGARFYWSLGYYGHAYGMIRNCLASDSTYFLGLLWGWDFAMQRGDTAQARFYLRQLRTNDRTNAVVQQFTLIEQTEDTLRLSSNPLRRSALYLSIARSYKIVDLPDEAIDDAQRALREDPRNMEAWLFQAQLFEEKKMPFAARAAFKEVLRLDPGHATAKAKLSPQKQ
ncbi:MAG: glycosyltransferase family 39 protein [Ignavibacteriales bacterium]|nr:glycosyltransferase family 39 protein [Ignavibacteriales bacterium]